MIGQDIATVEFGWPVGMPICQSMGDGLWEIRSSLPSNRIARVLVCFWKSHIVLLHGFIEKTKKTPPADLALAKSRKQEVQR